MMDALKTLETYIQVMLETHNEHANKPHCHTANQWNRGYQFGHQDGVKMGKTHLELLLKVLNSEREKLSENSNSAPDIEPGH